MKPLSVATRGYLDSPLGIATMGHLTVEVIILKKHNITSVGRAQRVMYESQEVERKVYLKRNPKLIREEDELTLILQTFLICQS
jgi:hypothetical protein